MRGSKHWREPHEHEKSSLLPNSSFSLSRNPETGHVVIIFFSDDKDARKEYEITVEFDQSEAMHLEALLRETRECV